MPTPYKFPYSRISYINWPYFYKRKNLALLKIGLSKNGRITKPECFIDTGAQYCMFNNSYAKYMGIENFKKVEKEYIMPISGIGGKREENRAYFHSYRFNYIYRSEKSKIRKGS